MSADKLNKLKEKAKDKYNEYYEILDFKDDKTIRVKCNNCYIIFIINQYNFLNCLTPCPTCRKEKGRRSKTDKYKPFENEKIIQKFKDNHVIVIYNSIDNIFSDTVINKNKKSDIKRCCFNNHQKIKNGNNKYSSCCGFYWFYETDMADDN